MLLSQLDTFDNGCDALTAADAGGGQAALQATAAELQREREQQPGAGHAERMSERDGAAVDVDPVAVQAELLLDRQVLRRKRLVDFNEVDIVQRELGLVEHHAG